MEFLVGLLAMIGSFLAGIFGNVLANDFCASTPRMCRRLIECAVRMVPDGDRARYHEEWLSHSNDLPGVFTKYGHACSCLIGAYRLTKEKKSEPPFRTLRIDYKHFGSVEFNYATHMALREFLSALPSTKLYISAQHSVLAVRVVLKTVAYARLGLNLIRAVQKYKRFGNFDVNVTVRFFELMTNSIVAHKTERTYYIDGWQVATKV
jgi:hypothetical protein